MNTVNKIVVGMAGCALFLMLAVLGFSVTIQTAPATVNAADTSVTFLAGDKDGFGAGVALGGDYVNMNTFTPTSSDPSAMDRPLVASSWSASANSYPLFTNSYASKPVPFTITVNLPAGVVITSAKLDINVADIDDNEPSNNNINDRLSIDSQDVPVAFDTTNQYLAGVAGHSGVVTFILNTQMIQTALADNKIEVFIDEPTRNGNYVTDYNLAEIFAIDYAELTLTYGTIVIAPFTCSSNAQCGTDGYVDSPVCSGNSVHQNYKTWICLNPGTASSSCQPNTVQQLKNNCSSNQTCQAGACVTLGTIACSSNNDCQATTYGSNYCSANTTIYRSKTSFSCMNPGQTSSYCQPNTIQEFQFSCYGNQTCQSGSCVANYTNTYNHHSYQQCYNNAVWWYDSNNSRQDVAQYCNSNQYCSGNTCVNQAIYYPPYNPPVYTNPVYGNAQMTVQVRNLSSGNLNWASSAVATPSDIVQFSVAIQATGNSYANNVIVKDVLPANLYYYNTLMVDGVSSAGNIASGVNIGNLGYGQTKTLTYQAQVAPAQNFVFGTTTLNDSVTATSTDLYNNYSIGSAAVVVTRSGVLGATTVSTGLTNNPWLDSFFLPLVLALLALWAYKSGVLNSLGFAGTRTSANTKLQSKIAQIKEKETV